MIFWSFSVVSRAGWGSEDMPLKGAKIAGAREKGFCEVVSSYSYWKRCKLHDMWKYTYNTYVGGGNKLTCTTSYPGPVCAIFACDARFSIRANIPNSPLAELFTASHLIFKPSLNR
jgi:hypothetical protein